MRRNLRRNRNAPSTAEANEALIEQIRANVAFEHIVVSVLAGAGVCSAILLTLRVGALLITGSLSVSTLLSALFASVVFLFLFFLVGFAAGAAIVTPLFRALEKSRRRSGWPYGAAALGVAAASLIAATAVPAAQGPSLAAVVSVIAASIVTSIIFARRMAPHWAAAEAAEREAAAAPLGFRLPQR